MSHFKIINQRIPAGIEGKGYEFFYSEKDQVIKCTHMGRTIVWDEVPEEGLEIIYEDMAKHPDVVMHIKDWNIHDPREMAKQYIFCRFGDFDGDPDIDENGKVGYAEYFDCGLRGVCKYEGKICTTIKLENGELTKRELEVLKLVAKGKLNKEIADELEIVEHTVNSHIQNIQQKGNFFRKLEMIVFAKDRNLV